MSGHGPIFEWTGFDTATLKKALSHLRALEKLGFDQNEDYMYSLQEEIAQRKEALNDEG